MNDSAAFSVPLPTLLRVDLSTGRLERQTLAPDFWRIYPGGTALGVRLLYDEVPPEVGWNDPRNRLMLLGGPLSAAPLPGAGGFTVVTRGAMTEGAASTQAQGVFGAHLRTAGLLGLVVQGAARNWSYLFIDSDGQAEIRDARHLVGLDTWETDAALRAELGGQGRDLSIACIGPAGENGVRFAGIFADRGHAAGHNGVGAVMGAKKLKAVVVRRSRQRLPLADPPRLAEVVRQLVETVKSMPHGVHYAGTLNSIHSVYAAGALPVRNYSSSVWDIAPEDFEKYTAAYIHANYDMARESPCWACTNLHCTMMTIRRGRHAGLKLEEPEYELLAGMSANIGVNDLDETLALGHLVDRLGFDGNEAGWVLGLVMECFERGILTGRDTGGLEVRWGESDAAAGLLRRIARREGLGDLLAEGVLRAVSEIGRGAEQIGVYTLKGASPRTHDHRNRWPELFDTTVSETGTIDNNQNNVDLTQFGLPEKIDPFDPHMVAQAEVKMKGGMQFEDSLVTCRFNTWMHIERLAAALSAVTGWDFSPEEGMQVGRRAVNLMRLFNIRCGLTPEREQPGPRYGSAPPGGPGQGRSLADHLGPMLQEYYAGMGWDESGRPRPETLSALGIEE